MMMNEVQQIIISTNSLFTSCRLSMIFKSLVCCDVVWLSPVWFAYFCYLLTNHIEMYWHYLHFGIKWNMHIHEHTADL